MGNQAKVTSTDAIEAFRASLIIFLTKANRSLADVNDEVRSVRQWLNFEQRTLWENEIRKRSRVFEQADAEYMSARLVRNNETALRVRKAAVEKAKRSIEEAQDKMRRVKQWSQNYDSAADPVAKRLEGMRQYIDVDMPKAIAYLVNVLRMLSAYAEGPPPEAAPSPTEITPDTNAGQPPGAPNL